MNLDFLIDEIKAMTGIHESRIRNIYLYGSRVYGTNKPNSDYDFLVVGNSLDREREIKHPKYNVHMNTTDKFQDDLWNYDITTLECIFAPPFARLQETIDYRNMITLDPRKVKVRMLDQSHNAWVKAKMKFRERDISRGQKCVWNSLKMLIFGLQMIESGTIYDFSGANDYWHEIRDSHKTKWDYFRETYLPLKRDLENILMDK